MRWIASISMLAGALVALIACGSTTNTPSPAADAGTDVIDVIDDARGELDAGGSLVAPFTCPTDAIQGEPRPAAQVLELLRVAAGLDSLGERVATRAGVDAGATAGDRDEVTAGVPCSTATNRNACESALAELSSDGEALHPAFDETDYVGARLSGLGAPPGYYLAHTKGDAVGKVSNQEELRALYPTVDAPAKAVVFAHAAGYRVECHLGGWLREEDGGYVLIASRGHEARCSRADVVLFVGRDGATEERQVIDNQPDPCT